MRLLAYLYLLCQSGALFTIPPAEEIYDVIVPPFNPATKTTIVVPTYITSQLCQVTPELEKSKSQFFSSTFITMAPLSRSALESRQKYLKDQGLGLDCGAWTGSHCTQVLPAKESGRTTGEATRTPSPAYDSEGSNSIMPLAVSYIILMNLITLWAAMSLA